jgi:hypothetical protein
MAAAYFPLEDEPAAVALTLKDQLVHLNMANYAETCSVCVQ